MADSHGARLSGPTSTTSRLTEARERIAKAGLPPPSIIVNSGNGVHLYWLLEEPYLIDDAGDPPAVEIEWIQTPDGRKKPRKYFLENGDRVYLDQRRHVSRLSPKAEHLHDVLAGIAKALGGDHTTDLSRLLRLPGPLNRKDQRSGREPVPTALVECEPSRRYAQQHRLELLGELIGMVERWKAAGMPMANTHSRFNKHGWGSIVGGILNACGEPDFLANAEEAATELDETRREFTELVGVLVEHPQGIWTAAELAGLCRHHGLLTADLGEGSPDPVIEGDPNMRKQLCIVSMVLAMAVALGLVIGCNQQTTQNATKMPRSRPKRNSPRRGFWRMWT